MHQRKNRLPQTNKSSRRRVEVDTLEPRTLCANFLVINTDNAGVGSLRDAIEKANATPAADTISFAISGVGVKTLSPKTALPTITRPVTIDGTTQAGYAPGAPKVVLDGAVAAALDPMNNDIDGLEIDAASSAVRGLVVNQWSGDGIEVRKGECKVQACFVGTDATGLIAKPNGRAGVRIIDSSSSLIGGTNPADRNVLSGNTDAGVSVKGADASLNTISGNYIGLGADGKTAVPNENGIVFFAGAHDNTVGGNTTGARNVISGNGVSVGIGGYGIVINDEETTGNRIRGNYIGTDATGLLNMGNKNTGILISGASGVTIGGDTPARRNVISGNSGGIAIDGSEGGTDDIRIYGNYIGTTCDGLSAIPNGGGIGIYFGGTGIRIGSTGNGEGNVISGNDFRGVDINDVSDLRIEGNCIGVDATGDAPLGNGGSGVYADGAFAFEDNVIRQNVVSANGGYGIHVTAGGGHGNRNTIQGNFIGTNHDGTVPFGNAEHGIELTGNNNLIGGTGAGEGNVISGNGGDGLILYVEDTYSADYVGDDNQVLGNRIGTDITGKFDFGNGGNGIVLRTDEQFVNPDAEVPASVRRTIIGNATAAGRNIISGNNAAGVLMEGAGASDTRLFGNYIGTDATGTVAIPNEIGVNVQNGANQNRIGGEKAGQGNLISGNTGQGVVFNTGAYGNTVRGNRIGTAANGKSPLGNGASGVLFGSTASHWNVVGHDSTSGANTIAFNGMAGIRVFGGYGQKFIRNSIFSNTGVGIDLGPLNGVTPNDTLLDSDDGPNGLQNYPVLSGAVYDGVNLTVTGSLNSAANSTYAIQLFSDIVRVASAAEGRTYLTRINVQTNAMGFGKFTVTIPTASPGTHVTALAMSSVSGNTSEFSAPIAVG